MGYLEHFWNEIEKEPKPDVVNKGPFDVFVIIDGHRGTTISDFIKRHFWQVFYRNRNIMVRKRMSKGLK